jgi:hypothetical protein
VIGSVRGRVSVWALASAVDVDVDGHYALHEPLLLVCESDEEAVTCMDYDTNSRMLVCVFGSRSSRTWPFELLVPAFHVVLLCVSSYCYFRVLILLHICPHTAIYVSSYTAAARPRRVPHTYTHSVSSVSSYCYKSRVLTPLQTQYMCVLILLHICPQTATYVSSCCYICVLILLHKCPRNAT